MMATSHPSSSLKQREDHDTQGYLVQLPMFEGPLDLLLHLIEREELDITKVALAQVTDQYLAYLAVLKEIDAELLTDFLVVAAKLLLTKSQALLPKPPPSLADDEEEDIGDQLAYQLRVYKQFKLVAEILHQREIDGLRNFVRVALPPRLEPKLSWGDLTLDELVAAVRQALVVRPPDPVVGEVVSPMTVTIGEQMTLIRDELTRRGRINFQDLLRQAASRLEIIVTFLAVLELIKQYVIDVRQDILFGDIIVLPGKSRSGGRSPNEIYEATDNADDSLTDQNLWQGQEQDKKGDRRWEFQ